MRFENHWIVFLFTVCRAPTPYTIFTFLSASLSQSFIVFLFYVNLYSCAFLVLLTNQSAIEQPGSTLSAFPPRPV